MFYCTKSVLSKFLYLYCVSFCCSSSRISPWKINTGLCYLIRILHEGRKHINLHMLCEPCGTLWTGSGASHNAPCVEHWWQKGNNWSVLCAKRFLTVWGTQTSAAWFTNLQYKWSAVYVSVPWHHCKKKKKRNMSLPLERSIYNIGNFKLGHISFGPKPLQSRFMIMVELSIREVFVMSSGPTK